MLNTIFEFLNKLIGLGTTFIFILLLFPLLLLVISSIKIKRVPLLGLLLLIISLLYFGISYLPPEIFEKYFDFLNHVSISSITFQYEHFLIAILILSNLINLLTMIFALIQSAKKIQIIKLLPTNIDTNIYAYLTKSSKVFYLTSRFYAIFNSVEEKTKNYQKMISSIKVDGTESSLKKLAKQIKKSDEKFDVDITLINEEIVSLTVEKKAVLKNEKIKGYILLNQKETIEVRYKEELEYKFKNRLYQYLDLMGEAVGFFDNDSKKYLITPKMMELLGVKENEISFENFEKLVSDDDKETFRKREAKHVASKEYFKVKTINDLEWFEENTYLQDDEEFYLIRHASFLQYRFAFKGYDQLLSDLNQNFKEKKRFGFVILSLDNIKDIVKQIGNDFSDVLIVKYFTKLSETSMRGKYETYKVSNLEFALIFDNINDYNIVIRDLSKDVCQLTSSDVYFNETRYTVKASVGLVDSNDILEPTTTQLMKAAFDCLYMATDETYSNNYCIYVQKKPAQTTYRFEDYKIDLTDKDVDDILK